MQSLLFALITVFGWGTWIAPSQKVIFPNQQIKTLYVVATNLVIATVVGLWQGGVWELTAGTFWLTLLGGVIWAGGGFCAFTGTNKLGMAKAFGIWAPLNIIVSLLWGAILFDEFATISSGAILLLVAAIMVIVAGVLMIILAKGSEESEQERGAYRAGFAGAVGAGILWGSYFIPVKYSGVSAWAGAFPLAIGMAIGGTLLAVLSRHSWKLAASGDYVRAGLTGDVIGFPALASTGMEQARVAMVHAFNLLYKEQLSPVLPYAIYTIPEIAMVGLTEEECVAKGIPYLVGRAEYARNPRGQIIGETHGMLKLIFSPADKKLLGVHHIGELSSELVHIGMHAIFDGDTIDEFIMTVYNYPTLSDAYKYAAYDGLGAWERWKG